MTFDTRTPSLVDTPTTKDSEDTTTEDFDKDDNDQADTEISPDIDNFIEDLIDAVDSFLWCCNAHIPHRSGIDNDGYDDASSVFSKSEKEDLYGEIYAVIDSWFN